MNIITGDNIPAMLDKAEELGCETKTYPSRGMKYPIPELIHPIDHIEAAMEYAMKYPDCTIMTNSEYFIRQLQLIIAQGSHLCVHIYEFIKDKEPIKTFIRDDGILYGKVKLMTITAEQIMDILRSQGKKEE